MTTTSWTNTPDILCNDYSDAHADQECSKFHRETDIIDGFERFAFWENGNKADTLYEAVLMEDFVAEVTELGPFETGECRVKDLATGDELDAAEFLAARQ